VARTGTLAYFSGASSDTTPVWLDAAGAITGSLKVPAGHYDNVAVSPDGALAVLVRSTSPSESDLWLVDLARGGASRVTSGHGRNDAPVWSPDSKRVVFSSDRDGNEDVFVKTLGDASPETPLFRSDHPFKQPTGWSPDGRWIVITQLDADTAQDVWLLPAFGKQTLVPFVLGPARDNGGPVSPDGRWLAYESEDSGRFELYVQSLPVPGQKVQVSEEGAGVAWWTRDGRGLVFVDERKTSVWRVDVQPGATLRFGTPRRVARLPPGVTSLDPLPDRQRFIAIVPEHAGPGSVTVVQNWRAALARE
jgi:Tol biopolymer transport system component